jgi:outer membrane protein assembly factor BamA
MRVFIAALLCVWHIAVVRADETCVDLTTLDEAQLANYPFKAGKDAFATRTLQRNHDYVAGDVRVVIQPIFDTSDPDEDHAVYRWANRLHMQTRPHVIRQAIPFREGEPVTVSAILEAERILRAKPYIYDARVIPRRLCGDRLDIDVVARDVWTLTPDVDFSRSGGDNSYGYGLTDTNILGAGRTLSLFFQKDPDREGQGIFYQNPNVAGTRVAFETLFADYSDGSRHVVDVGQPFYSLDAKHALGMHLEEADDEQGLYLFGDKFARFSQDFRALSISGGLSAGERQRHTWRWLAGYNYEEHEFSAIPGQIPPNPLPANRTFGYPWIGFASIEDRFDTTFNVDRIQRTEDLNLGREYNMLFGWSDSTFGGDDQRRLVVQGAYRDGVLRDGKHLIFYGAALKGYWNFDTNRSEEVAATTYATYRQQQTGRFSLAAAFVGRAVHNLPTDQQLLGGGDSGLRGYPSRYQWGNRSYLFSVEERYFSDIYIARIVRLGFAAFFDAGRTWFADNSSGGGLGTLADVGFGLRFESTRTRQDRVLHVDLAFPLVDGPDVQSMQILLVVKERL